MLCQKDCMLSHFRGRLQAAIWSMSHRIAPTDLSCLQVWMLAINQSGLDALQKQLYSDPELFIMGNPALMPFRLSSCQSMQWGHQGMPGRVLRSGCVQVVQNLRIIPEVLHPRCRLPDPIAAGVVGELVYIPVYDLHAPHAGPVAVLEALLSATAADSMLVANFISVAGSALSCVQLSLSNPLPQPVRRSKLEGRKPRPVHADSSEDLTDSSSPAGQHHTVPVLPPQPPPPPPAAASQHACQQQQAAAPTKGAYQQGVASTLTVEVPQHQQTLISCSSGSAGTIVAAASVSTPCSSPAECTLSSTLSSSLSDVCAAQATAAVAAASAAAAHDAPAAGTMLPPRPCATSLARPPHRRRWQEDDAVADDSQDAGASPPPCKLRRTLSMVRTKSVPSGLDQVLNEAMAGSEPATSC